ALTVAIAAHAVFTALRLIGARHPEIRQGIDAFGGHQKHAAAIAAVAAIRPAQRNEFFAPETDTAVPAVAGQYAYGCFVKKFHNEKRRYTRSQYPFKKTLLIARIPIFRHAG